MDEKVLGIHSFIHLVVCLTTGPKPLPNPALHIVSSRASSFKLEYGNYLYKIRCEWDDEIRQTTLVAA
jgi:hypothetical protein